MHPLLLAFRLKRNGTHNHVMKINLPGVLYTCYKPFWLLNETTLPSSASLLCAYVLQNAARNHNAEKGVVTPRPSTSAHFTSTCLRLFFHLLLILYCLAPCPRTQLIGAAENQPSTRSIRNSGQCAWPQQGSLSSRLAHDTKQRHCMLASHVYIGNAYVSMKKKYIYIYMHMTRMNQIVLHHSSVCGKALLGERWRGKNTSDAFISCANPERKTA